MRVLAVADRPSEVLWGPGVRERLRGVELILSCGDLPPQYLEYLVTLSSAPLVYVHGNHDGRRGQREPEGCLCAEDRVVTVKGARILGLGGSAWYNGEGAYQYTQGQMRRRVRRRWWDLRRGVDILLTHSAPLGLGDGTDPAHVGFSALRDLLDRHGPPVMVHGHSHLNYDRTLKRVRDYGSTRLINAYERHIFELEL